MLHPFSVRWNLTDVCPWQEYTVYPGSYFHYLHIPKLTPRFRLRESLPADSLSDFCGETLSVSSRGIDKYVVFVGCRLCTGIHKSVVRFQRWTRNLLLTWHEHNVHRQQVSHALPTGRSSCLLWGRGASVHCRPLQRTCYTESGMNLITVWMCVVWPRVHKLKDCD